MKAKTTILAVAAVVTSVAGYYLWVSTRIPMVSIYMSGSGKCVVSKNERTRGMVMECTEVAEFLRDKSGSKKGAKVLLGSWREVSPTDVDTLRAALMRGGYRIEGPFKVAGFVNDEPASR